jgi:hypothetical protein
MALRGLGSYQPLLSKGLTQRGNAKDLIHDTALPICRNDISDKALTSLRISCILCSWSVPPCWYRV